MILHPLRHYRFDVYTITRCTIIISIGFVFDCEKCWASSLYRCNLKLKEEKKTEHCFRWYTFHYIIIRPFRVQQLARSIYSVCCIITFYINDRIVVWSFSTPARFPSFLNSGRVVITTESYTSVV